MTDPAGNPLRLMLVHAHPDDETTTTGATIARYAAEGVGVELVTCPRGERGEMLAPDLATQLSDPDPDKAARLKSSLVEISNDSGISRTASAWGLASVVVHKRHVSSLAATSNGKSPNAPTARSI